jgi:hypothetical protein
MRYYKKAIKLFFLKSNRQQLNNLIYHDLLSQLPISEKQKNDISLSVSLSLITDGSGHFLTPADLKRRYQLYFDRLSERQSCLLIKRLILEAFIRLQETSSSTNQIISIGFERTIEPKNLNLKIKSKTKILKRKC